jgi:molecular chaperone HscB
MNFFEFYDLPISFRIDESALKRLFYTRSRAYHPDYFTLESAEKQAEILELSTLNTQAYKTLSDFDKRMRYILELKGILAQEGKNQIPQDFLMEMMDINEAIMELEFDFDAANYRKVLNDVESIENELLTDINPILDNYSDTEGGAEKLEKIKKNYLKKRYLLRIRENLSKFAPLLK